MKKRETALNNGDSDSLFSDFLDARARRAKEKLVAREMRAGHADVFASSVRKALKTREIVKALEPSVRKRI